MTGFNIQYMIEMLLPILGISIPIMPDKKRALKGLSILLIAMILITVGVQLAFSHLSSNASIEKNGIAIPIILFWFFINWGILIIFIKATTNLNMRMSIYIFAIAYAVEHIFYCFRLVVAYATDNIIASDVWFLYVPCLIGSFLVAYFWFARPTAYRGQYIIDNTSSVTYVFAILFLVWGLSILASFKDFQEYHSVYAIICCVFILLSQRSQMLREIERMEFASKEQLWEKNRIRYQISRDSMAVVNQHYHDMKHQIKALSLMEDGENRKAYLQELESNIAAYDAVVRTGNDYLDTVLTEKKLTCQTKHIAMSCIADGSQLTFIDELDLYTLMGNVLDNAIEANEKIEAYEKRFISVQIQNKKGVILVEVVNPYTGELSLENSLPKTTKTDTFNHGYGITSIKSLTEKYGGQLIVKAENHRFLLRLIFQV